MRKMRLFQELLATLILLSSMGCAPHPETAMSSSKSPSTTARTTLVPGSTLPPTVQELRDGGFTSPEVPRITAEALKLMMDNAKETGAYTGFFSSIDKDKVSLYWNDFVIVDTLPTSHYNSEGNVVERDNHIQGSVNIPFTFYRVNNPQDLKPEQVETYQLEKQFLEQTLYRLPKDKLIIIYDETGTDEAACILADKLLDNGYNPELVTVLWKGFNRWYFQLEYVVVQSDWSYPG